MYYDKVKKRWHDQNSPSDDDEPEPLPPPSPPCPTPVVHTRELCIAADKLCKLPPNRFGPRRVVAARVPTVAVTLETSTPAAGGSDGDFVPLQASASNPF